MPPKPPSPHTPAEVALLHGFFLTHLLLISPFQLSLMLHADIQRKEVNRSLNGDI